jgi:hypothetical protein
MKLRAKITRKSENIIKFEIENYQNKIIVFYLLYFIESEMLVTDLDLP